MKMWRLVACMDLIVLAISFIRLANKHLLLRPLVLQDERFHPSVCEVELR